MEKNELIAQLEDLKIISRIHLQNSERKPNIYAGWIFYFYLLV